MLSAQDHGKGIEPVRITESATPGIQGIQKRATLLGGERSIQDAPGRGTSVEVRLPSQEPTGTGEVRR